MQAAVQVLVEQSLLGWKEYELEVMRDLADNVVIICSIENVDPMGVHTGDSITVAPQQTLTDREYQRLRDASVAIIREMGVECGGSNVQVRAPLWPRRHVHMSALWLRSMRHRSFALRASAAQRSDRDLVLVATLPCAPHDSVNDPACRHAWIPGSNLGAACSWPRTPRRGAWSSSR
jgi:hypothetical protein